MGDSESRGFEFIEEYFRCGGKEKLLQDIEEACRCEDFKMRAEHTRSAFLLGIHIYDTITPLKKSIKKVVSGLYDETRRLNDEETRKKMQNEAQGTSGDTEDRKPIEIDDFRCEFLYLWYLICLYHDIGYIYERNNTLPPENHFPNEIQKTEWIPNEILLSCDKYYRIRKSTPLLGGKPCIDHGIYGGMRLYHILRELHASPAIKKLNDNGNSLSWGKPILYTYITHAAWCIMGHNMFFAEHATLHAFQYCLLGLHELIFIKEHSLVSPSRHPLLFLLNLVDTIEPIKHFNNNKELANKTKVTSSKGNFNNNKELANKTKVTSSKGNTLSFLLCPDKKLKDHQCHLNPPCQFYRDCGYCAKYACNRTLADNLSFLVSPEFSVNVDHNFSLHLTFNCQIDT